MALSFGPKLGLLIDGLPGESHYSDLMKQWRGLDALVQASVKDKDLATPPGSPADGDCYIVAGPPTGVWSGHTGKIARWSSVGSVWEFYAPKKGWRVSVDDENTDYRYDGAAWVINSSVVDAASMGALINGAAAKSTPVDADLIGIVDSAAGNILKKLTWANLKATLKTYFDALYAPKAMAMTTVTSSSGVLIIDLALGKYFKVDLFENISSISIINGPAAGHGDTFWLYIKQHASTAYTVTFASGTFRPAQGITLSIPATLGKLHTMSATTGYDSKWDVTITERAV